MRGPSRLPPLVSVLLVSTLYPVYADTSPNPIAEDGSLESAPREISYAQASLDGVAEVSSIVE